MAKIEVKKNSWLKFSDLLESQGIAFWDQADFPEITPQENDLYITVDDRTAGNLDLIAHDMYRDADLWWVIALANKIDLIPTDVFPNRRLRIPNQSFVNSLIGRGGVKQ